MKKHLTLKLLPAALLAAYAGSGHGAGFQLLEQNASGIGNAYAGSAAVAENASTIFFNPAGLTTLKGASNVSVGVSGVRTSFKFTNQGSSSGGLSGDGGDGGGIAAIPNAYLSLHSGDVAIGLGVSAPFGLATEYDDGWVGGAQAQEFDVKTVNLNPTVAFKVNEALSLGAGANLQRLDVKYTRIASVLTTIPVGPGFVDGTQHDALLEADDTALGWNVGALFKLSPATQLGLSYRSKTRYTVTGRLNVTGGSGPLDAAFNAAQSADAYANIELPDTLILSAAHQLNDKLQLLADVSRTGWSSIDKVNIMRVGSSTPAQTLDADFRDTWRAALGAKYQVTPTTKLKLGVAYDQTPVKEASTRLVSLPDEDRLWLSIGAQYDLAKSGVVDVGFAYLHVKDPEIDNDQTPLRGRVTGTYDANVMILGVQYSQSF